MRLDGSRWAVLPGAKFRVPSARLVECRRESIPLQFIESVLSVWPVQSQVEDSLVIQKLQNSCFVVHDIRFPGRALETPHEG